MEESKEVSNRSPYRSLPIELKTMILTEAMSEKVVTVWKNHILDAPVAERSLLQVNAETRGILRHKENNGSGVEMGNFPDALTFHASSRDQTVRLDLESAILKVFDMELPMVEVREGESEDPWIGFFGEQLVLPLPFRRVISISKDGWRFPWNNLLRTKYPEASTAERLRFMALKPWPVKANLPHVKEVTLVTRFGPADFMLNGFKEWTIFSDKLAAYALGADPEKGIWLGFRYFKETGRIQFTPLIADDASFALSEAKKIYRNRLPHYDVENPLVIKVSIIERGESPVDEPHHMWTDLQEPDQNDNSWVQQACTAWKFARRIWLTKVHAKTILYCDAPEDAESYMNGLMDDVENDSLDELVDHDMEYLDDSMDEDSD
ncbi:hypothetical protein BGZ61DRAFT_553785 [Ilyonectria robusta]|uniref:uncharacterized protein n=1 Tax=Ilyonectria robusta TaxID=1079257 RepID=UPI001E8D5C26|nr:uncharacterized protein BGZ61DRAFT_553785 [Ilyonectria robusta]KAH8736078.1 hypothetical protein BGZ61DRAFT_553785 [Ilyonectria robusta]